jgi:hypothetical protein
MYRIENYRHNDDAINTSASLSIKVSIKKMPLVPAGHKLGRKEVHLRKQAPLGA